MRLGFGALPDAQVTTRPLATPATAAVRLEDDDDRGLMFTPSSLLVSDQGVGISGNGEYTLSLMSQPTAAVTVTWAADSPDPAGDAGRRGR